MAARFLAPSTLSPSPLPLFLPQRNRASSPFSNSVDFSSFRSLETPSQISRQLNRRRLRVAAVGGTPPSASTLILVFVLPLSLLVGTIAVSIRIGNKLEEKFLEEIAVNQAMIEESKDEGEEGGEVWDDDWRARSEEEEEDRVLVKEETVRIRSRPKRKL